MAEELWQTLMRFHREVFAPDLRRIMSEAFGRGREMDALQRDMNRHFEAINARFDAIESGLHEVATTVSRIESLFPPTSTPA